MPNLPNHKNIKLDIEGVNLSIIADAASTDLTKVSMLVRQQLRELRLNVPSLSLTKASLIALLQQTDINLNMETVLQHQKQELASKEVELKTLASKLRALKLRSKSGSLTTKTRQPLINERQLEIPGSLQHRSLAADRRIAVLEAKQYDAGGQILIPESKLASKPAAKLKTVGEQASLLKSRSQFKQSDQQNLDSDSMLDRQLDFYRLLPPGKGERDE